MIALIDAITDMREEDALKITNQELEAGTDPLIVLDDCRRAMEIIRQRGFILSTGSVLDDARQENIHAFIDAGKKYGVFSPPRPISTIKCRIS